MRLLISTLILFVSLQVSSQGIEIFKVIATQGISLVERESEKENWKPIQEGTQLFRNDKVIVTEGSYMALVHYSGKSLEMNRAGVFEINKLAEGVKEKKLDQSDEYLKYIVSDLLGEDKNEHFVLKEKENSPLRAQDSYINLSIPDKSWLSDNILVLNWQQDLFGHDYEVKVYNMFDELIWEESTSDTFSIIMLDELNTTRGEFVLARVTLSDQEKISSDLKSIYIPTESEFSELNNALTGYKAELDMTSPLDHMKMAAFYEEHNCYQDALTEYQILLDYLPESDAVKNAYRSFSQRHNLKDQAIK